MAARETEGDDVLECLAGVTDALAAAPAHIAAAMRGAEAIRVERAAGARFSAILAGREGALVAESLKSMIESLSNAAGRLRRAQARALYADGLSMDKIGRVLGVSRQRVSSLLRSSTQPDADVAVGAPKTPSRGRPRRGDALALTDADFRMVAESLPHIVWIADPDGNTLYVNAEGAGYAGIHREAVCDRRSIALVHPDDAERARAAWQTAVASETPFELDSRLRRADGAFRWHSFRAQPLRGADGRVVKWIGTATDIDAGKRLEQLLRQRGREAP